MKIELHPLDENLKSGNEIEKQEEIIATPKSYCFFEKVLN